MNSSLDWPAIRSRAAAYPEEAFEFVRDGLRHTVQNLNGKAEEAAAAAEARKHVTGQQLCLGLRELAVKRYGLLASLVLRRWRIAGTEDFGTIVYAMIDRGELRASPNDNLNDFKAVYDFAQAFEKLQLN